MKRLIENWCAVLFLLLSVGMVTSCSLITDDLDGCPDGLYVTLKYDYNLQRTDLFKGNVGAVTLYIFNADGKLVNTVEDNNLKAWSAGSETAYTMHVTGLEPGKYRLVALAGQCAYDEMTDSRRAGFIRSDMQPGSDISALSVRLEGETQSDGLYHIVNNGLPLDTLWHGMTAGDVEVYDDYSNRASYVTMSLMRDTKEINVSLRDLDDPEIMDIADYDIRITDHNSHILWDNSLDETASVVYTPYKTWNSYDLIPGADAGDGGLELVTNIANADFMTSRLVLHGDDSQADGRLLVTDLKTGDCVADINLPALLSRLTACATAEGYSAQELLDRGCAYNVQIWFRDGKPEYIVLSTDSPEWSMKIQYNEL